ncbi:MAG: phage terminase large subunit [Methanoregula sp.]|nr:phage terminase large subunit [Methanoregula sp.]
MAETKSPHNIIRAQPGKQTAFLSSPADIIVYGGAGGGGKTFGLLIDPLRHIKRVKGFGAVIFRRETPQITNEGGLLDESYKIYPSQGGVARESPKIDWTFPPFDNRIHFDHLQYEKTCQSYDGAQICYIGFDQLEHFTEYQFFYMFSRNRSACGIRPCIRATANPDADSWLVRGHGGKDEWGTGFISWWIHPVSGYPIEARSGAIRWFLRDNDELVWADTEEELIRKYPGRQPKSVTFIPAKLSDNPILENINPEYRGNLQALSYVEQERLLEGNWKIRLQAGTVFKREWFDVVDDKDIPKDGATVRYWDMAATRKSKKNKEPDWTSGFKMCTVGGLYYILDVYRIRDNPGETEAARKHITAQDGPGVKVREEQEGGASGKTVIFLNARDQFRGSDYLGVPSSGSKQARAVPASRAAYNGLIKVRRAAWNDLFFAEIEAFPDGKHDDIADSFSGAYNELAKGLRDPTNEPTADEAVTSGVQADDFGLDADESFFGDEGLGGLFG